jgi:LPS-assembly lipoprotein
MKKILFSLLLLLMSGCTFHLRSPANLPPQLKKITIDNTNSRSSLTSQLASTLQDLGVQVTKPSQTAPIILAITNDAFSQSSSTLGTAQLLNSITLNYNVTFILRDNHGNNLTMPASITSNASYLQNANQVLGDTSAIPALQQQLVHDMIQRIIAKLSAQQVHSALTNLPS